MLDYHVFNLGNLTLQSGQVLPNAKLAYTTVGTLNPDRRNAILFPTYYTGTHRSNAAIVGPGWALDPERYFIIVPNLFGNGISSSPSNTPAPDGGGHFPHITLYDNVIAQHRLLTEVFGLEQLALILGWSMGGQQAYHWAALFPDWVKRMLVICGSAKTSRHNWVFLEGVKAALTADDRWQNRHDTEPPEKGLKAFGRVYAGWAYSQAFFREQVYQTLGFETAEDLLRWWEADHLTWDAHDLLAMLWSWQHADISANPLYNGDFQRALGAIAAKSIIMPASTDLYFPPEDNAIEVSLMPQAELRILDSIWGHCAGGPNRNPNDTVFIESAIQDLLRS